MPCNLIDGWGVGVQVALGFLAFSSLALKRWCERPRRPLKIWMFDASKQALANSLVHVVNVLSSNVLSKDTEDSDPCTWYFINVCVDSTLGLAIIYGLIKLSSRVIHRRKWELLYSGYYGPLSRPSYRAWLYQLSLYVTIAMVEKGVVLLVLLLPFWSQLGEAILRSMSSVSPQLEAIGVMLIFPFIVTAIWFWCVDNFLMNAEGQQMIIHTEDGRGAYDILLNDIGGGAGLQESSCGSSGGSSSEEDEGPAVARGN